MIGLLVAGAVAVSASGIPAAAAAPPAPAIDRSVPDARINESSGLAVSPAHPGLLWTHDDSGNPPRLFALGPSGRVAATVRVTGVPDVDWEALAAFRDPAGRALLAVGDVGDNLAHRDSVEVDVVPEPSQRGDGQVAALLRLRLRYPDGPRDAETLLVDRERGRMFLVSKGLFASQVYAVPASAWNGTAPSRPTLRSATLVRIGTVPLVLVTDGAVAPSGAILLRTYGELAVLDPLPLDGGRRLLVPRATAALPTQRQGEGLALAPDGRSVLLSSEGVGQPVLRFPLPDDVRAAVSSPAPDAARGARTPRESASTIGSSASSPGSAGRPAGSQAAGPTGTSASSVGGLGLAAGLAAIGAAAVLGSLGRVARRRGRRSS